MNSKGTGLSEESSEAHWIPMAGRTVVAAARGAISSVRVLAWLAGVAAVWLWGWIFFPFDVGHWWVALMAAAGLLVLLLPSIMLFLLVLGLGQLTRLPDAVVEQAQSGRVRLETAAAAVRTGPHRGIGLWAIMRAIRGLWIYLADSKGMVLQYVALARFANPVSLMVLLGAAAVSAVLVGVAAVTMAWTLLTLLL